MREKEQGNMVKQILQSVNNGSLLAVFCFSPPETEEGQGDLLLCAFISFFHTCIPTLLGGTEEVRGKCLFLSYVKINNNN